jgi:CheY-like chemotaxis protein
MRIVCRAKLDDVTSFLGGPGAEPTGAEVEPVSTDVEVDEAARRMLQRPTAPPSAAAVTELAARDAPFELPERAFFEQLDARARRAELLTALLGAGGVPPESAVLALQAALGAIVASAEDAQLPTLANLATALRTAIGRLGVGSPIEDELRIVDTLVFDESEVSRDLVALAVEAQGHTVRCASRYEDFVRELEQRRPGLIITEAQLSNAPAKSFCATLQELLATRRIPLVFFSDLDAAELGSLAKSCGARRSISKELGIDRLIGELRAVYREIVDIRQTGGRPRFRPPSTP